MIKYFSFGMKSTLRKRRKPQSEPSRPTSYRRELEKRLNPTSKQVLIEGSLNDTESLHGCEGRYHHQRRKSDYWPLVN